MAHGMADGRGKGLSASFPRKGIGHRLRRCLATDQGRCVWGLHIRIASAASCPTFKSRGSKTLFWWAIAFGGSVIQKVAEEIPSLVERTVFLDALIVEDGHCVFDELPAEYVALFNDLARGSSDNTMLIPWEVWRDNFTQDATEPGARSLWEQLSPEPNQVNLDRLDLKRFGCGYFGTTVQAG